MTKRLKFKDALVRLIIAGQKDSTWRLFDDKHLAEGDVVECVNADTGEKFAEAVLTKVYEKKIGELDEFDFAGHEKFATNEEMYRTYRSYYGDRVSSETVIKIARFRLVD